MNSKKMAWIEEAHPSNEVLENLLCRDPVCASETFPLLQEKVQHFLSSYQFNSQNRWGLQIKSQEIRTLSTEFCRWYFDTQAWKKLSNYICETAFSFDLYLSREWLRFSENKKAKKPPSIHRWPEEYLACHTLDVFTQFACQLPDTLRLPYLLYLEGLITEEIASIYSSTSSSIDKKINKAKIWMQDPSNWRVPS